MADVRAAHPSAAHPYTDSEALDTAKSVAGWVWSRYVGGQLTRVRADAAVRQENDRQRGHGCPQSAWRSPPRRLYLAEVQRRRTAANTLRGLGVAVVEIARRLGASIRSVHRWISEIRCVPSPSALSDFERPPQPNPGQNLLTVTSNEVVELAPETARAASERSEASTEVSTQSTFGTNGTDDQRPNDPGEGVRGRTNVESSMTYIRRRIAEIVGKRGDDARPP